MTDPTFAQNVPGKGRYYFHPTTGEKWPSVTNILDTAVSKPALVPWASKAVAEKAMAELPRLVASYRIPSCKPRRVADGCGKCRTCLLREIKSEPGFVKDMAADLGTRIHAWADGHVLGKPNVEDPEVAPYGRQLLRFFHEHGVNIDTDVEATEATIVNRTIGYAGTGDLWVRLRTGASRKRLVLIDYKSSATRPALSVYPEQGMQLAALAHAETILLDDGTEVDAPQGIKAVFILTLRADNYALIPMPLDGDLTAAFTGFTGALADAKYLHSQYGLKPTALQPAQPEQKAS